MTTRLGRRGLPILLAVGLVAGLSVSGPVAPAGATGLAPAVAISAGQAHTCVLSGAGGVKCWGFNGDSELGDGTTINRLTPVDVWGLTSGVTAISAGFAHTCALTTEGGVRCWGSNVDGELGIGTFGGSASVPVDVSGLGSGVTAISAGTGYTCALTTAGGVKCWGANAGQLGDGTSTSRSVPVDVAGLDSGVIAISAGSDHACAVTTAGGVKCWGVNGYGQLGDGTISGQLTPVDVVGLDSGVIAVSASGFHTCALTATGGVKCWGFNGDSELGDGTTTDGLTPVDVSGLTSGVVAIAASGAGSHTCGLSTAGGVKCWGANQYGQLGDGTTTNPSTPVDVSGLTSGVIAISAGFLHSCALTAAGSAKCWGRNQFGQLGDGTITDRWTAVDVLTEPDSPTIGVATGGNGSASVTFVPGLDGGSAITGFTATCTSSDGGATGSASGAESPIVVNGLTNGKTYTCTVTATNAIGTSAPSAASNAVVPTTAVPDAPTIGTATRGNASGSVSFAPPASDGGSVITSFVVSCTSSNGGASGSASGPLSPIVVSGLTNGKTYTCTATATNAVGTSVTSAASNTFVPATVPGAPTSPSAIPGNGRATVTWAAPASNGGSAVTGYAVTPYLAGVAQPTRVFNSAATTEIITGLTNTKSYTFKVAALNAVGTGEVSVASAPILVGLPTAPTGVNASANVGRAIVWWTAPAHDGGLAITAYVVTPYIAGAAQPAWVFASTATAETITGLTNGRQYTFKVAASNGNGVGPQSAPMSPITVGPPTTPSAPTVKTVVPGNGQVTLTWTAPVSNGSASITGYIVTPYVAGVAQPIRTFNVNTSQIVTGLTNAKTYTFKVAAGNAAGTGSQSAASGPITVGTPVAPTLPTAVAGNAQATVWWTAAALDNGSAITGYVVTPYKAGVAQAARVFASTATTQIITGLTTGTPYTFKVAAKNARGTGPRSDASSAVAAMAAGFWDTTVWSGLTGPTAMAFAADGSVFVAEKSGLIKVFADLSATQPKVFADLSVEVDDYSDRGLLGLASDPSLGQTGHNYIYVLYTYDAPPGHTAPVWNDKCPSPPGANTDGCVVTNVLSRIPVNPDGTAGPEQRLIAPRWCQQFPSHSAGHLAFGPDGMLYVSAGEGASYDSVDYGQYGGSLAGTPTPANPCGDPPGSSGTALTAPTGRGGALRAQSPRRPAGEPISLDGTVLRVDPATGAGVPGNPSYDPANPQSNASRILAFGLRNPFRFTVRPGTSEVWVGDVGANLWEEINRIRTPTNNVMPNLGWPCYEGTAQQSGYAQLDMCKALYADTARPATAPYYKYDHGSTLGPGDTCPAGSSSISGLAFSTTRSYPSAYAGALFFADYSRNCIWVMYAGANGLPDPATIKTFVSNADNPYPVDLEIDPLSGDLFYVNIGGSIHRISYDATNQPPIANAMATPTYGLAPLTVQFDASHSSDPNSGDGDTLSYSWDLNGDGTFGDSTAVRPTFTYDSAGQYTAVLRVTDSHGASSSQSITISSGNTPPRPVIDSPSSSLKWAANDQITFSAHADDDQDGQEPASSFSWTLLLYHCPSNCHTHFLQTWTGVSSGSFAAPDHDYPSYLVLKMTVTDAGGLSSTTSVRLDPKTTTLTFGTSPSGLQVVVDGTSGQTPFARTVIVHSTHSIDAPSPQQLNGTTYTFATWSDQGAKTHTVIALATPTTYKATFAPP